MMRKLITLPATLVLSCFSVFAMAQDTDAVTSSGQSQGFMTAHGKIGVVMVVCLTVLAGLILYIVRLDRKLSRLEKMEKK
jgi:hypothetical protein